MTPLLLLPAVCYAALLLLCAAAVRGARAHNGVRPPFHPAVSVIIAARNEEENLPSCLASLAALAYPADRLEIIVVDDGSDDRTPDLLRAATLRMPALRTLTAPPQGALRGKVNALAAGIGTSRGEILLFTDADCVVPPRWVEETVKAFGDHRVGIAGGFTVPEGRGWFAGLQALDWVVLFSLAAATVRLRFPVTAVGNNLAVRRAAYDAVGGYAAIPFSVTEDFALFRAVTAAGWEARFPLAPGACVLSRPCATAGELFRQKYRWFLGGRGFDTLQRALFGVAFLFCAMIAAAAAAGEAGALAAGLSVKAVADGLLALPALRALGRMRLLPLLPLFVVFSVATTLVFPPLVLLRPRVGWKGRTVANDEAPR